MPRPQSQVGNSVSVDRGEFQHLEDYTGRNARYALALQR